MKHLKVGKLGEAIVANYLKKRGFVIQKRNFRRPWGEIDIIAKKKKITHFVEVKTRSIQRGRKPYLPGEVAVHPQKIKRLERAIMTYLENTDSVEWQLDVISIDLDVEGKKAHVRHLRNIF